MIAWLVADSGRDVAAGEVLETTMTEGKLVVVLPWRAVYVDGPWALAVADTTGRGMSPAGCRWARPSVPPDRVLAAAVSMATVSALAAEFRAAVEESLGRSETTLPKAN